MDKELEVQIADAEEQLRLAMLASDVNSLNELLAQNLVFTNHLGQRLGKEEDLSAHESGALTISELETSEQQITFVDDGDVAIVSVRAHIAGKYAGQPAGGDFRFTRVWTQTSGKKWQVVAGRGSSCRHRCLTKHCYGQFFLRILRLQNCRRVRRYEEGGNLC